MNMIEARRILDRLKDGAAYPLHTINRALEMTGDLNERHIEGMDAGMRGERMDHAIQEAQPRVWCQRSEGLVAIDDPRHRETQGQTSSGSIAKGDE